MSYETPLGANFGERFALTFAVKIAIRQRLLGAVACLAMSYLWLFFPVLTKLVRDWANDANYSHGFLIIPLACYLAWERRSNLAELKPRSTAWGLAIVGLSIAVLLTGLLGAELFLTRIAMI